MAVGTRMQQRRATAADWATANYTLAAGEIGVTTDTGIIKIGNGTSPWNELDPAFDSQYLPILGQAADSALLSGVSINSLVKVADTDVNPTNNTYVKRTADGGVKATDATENTEVTTLQQQTAAILAGRQLQVSQTLTASATLVLSDANSIVFVNHASTTANVAVTIPANATVAYPVGTVIQICARGAGGAKIVPDVGVTINGANIAMPGWGTVRLVKYSTNTWFGTEISVGKRLPTIKVVRTGSGESYVSTYAFVPWDQIEPTETYNPDNEFFSIPASGLPTARRIICNKDGEYLFNLNFNVNGTNTTWARICKMTTDNSTTGMSIIGVQSGVGCHVVTVKKRVTAGQTFGVHHGFAAGSTGAADAEGTGGNPCNFKITRLGD